MVRFSYENMRKTLAVATTPEVLWYIDREAQKRAAECLLDGRTAERLLWERLARYAAAKAEQQETLAP